MSDTWHWEVSYRGQNARRGQCDTKEAAIQVVENFALDRYRPWDASGRVWQAGADDKPAAWVWRAFED